MYLINATTARDYLSCYYLQLLKYVPLKEEVETLRENLSELDSFSRADKFMLEMSNIPRYEKRLKALSFTKTFRDRIDEVFVF